MKSIITIALIANVAHGAEQVSSVMAVDNKQIDPKKVEQFIVWAEPSIREYPPRFKDEEHKKRIYISTLLVTKEIQKIDPKTIKDAQLATNLGHILGMGHNLDLPTPEHARAFFEQALAISPEGRRENHLYGMFLISTAKYHMESLPYLQKAYSLGEKDAQFSIGLLLCQKGDVINGIKELESYSNANPKNEYVKKVIKGIKDGSLKFKQTTGS